MSELLDYATCNHKRQMDYSSETPQGALRISTHTVYCTQPAVHTGLHRAVKYGYAHAWDDSPISLPERIDNDDHEVMIALLKEESQDHA